MQSIFRLASPQRALGRKHEFIGDAELKMDWTEPRTEPDAMGIYSSESIRGVAFRDADSIHHEGWVRIRRGNSRFQECLGRWKAEQIGPDVPLAARWGLGTTRSDLRWARLLSAGGVHEVSGITDGAVGRSMCSTVTI